MEKIPILLNPYSGKQRYRSSQIEIEQAFEEYGLKHKIFVTRSENHLREMAQKFSREADIIVGVGGDTTMNIVAEEISGQYQNPDIVSRLGMIGTGSANDIINSLNIRTPHHLAKAIKEKSIGGLDVCRLNINKGEKILHFIGSMSLGLGVLVNEYIEDFKRAHRLIASNDFTGQLLPGIVGAFKGFRSGKLPQKATVNGEEYLFSLMVLMNTHLYANGLKLSDKVNPFDGALDLMVIDTGSVTETLKKMLKVSRGKEPEGLIQKQNKEYIIEFPAPTSIQLDGEVYKKIKSIKATVLKGVLPVFTGTNNKYK